VGSKAQGPTVCNKVGRVGDASIASKVEEPAQLEGSSTRTVALTSVHLYGLTLASKPTQLEAHCAYLLLFFFLYPGFRQGLQDRLITLNGRLRPFDELIQFSDSRAEVHGTSSFKRQAWSP
jgi:hypothetical protein